MQPELQARVAVGPVCLRMDAAAAWDRGTSSITPEWEARMPEDAAGPQPAEEGSPFGERSKAKMAELFAMAMAYRDWSQRELAAFVGRDVHNMIPPSGIPKVDVVMRLAKALDWSTAMVLEDICGERDVAETPIGSDDFLSLNRAAYAASLEGRHAEAVELARKAAVAARSPAELAEADRRESVAWDGLGRYHNAIECAERGLHRTGVSRALRAELRANLANCYLALGQFHEAEGISSALLDEVPTIPGPPALRTALEAHLRYVRGFCRLQRLEIELDAARDLGIAARADFEASRELWAQHASELGLPGFAGRGVACRAGVLYAEAVLGDRPTQDALNQFLQELDGIVDLKSIPKGDTLECYGWMCTLAAGLALRSEIDPVERDRFVAIFVMKLYEIADLSGNWALRERAFTADYLRGLQVESLEDAVLDEEDVRVIAGAMGRFPAFRRRGWELLRRAGRI